MIIYYCELNNYALHEGKHKYVTFTSTTKDVFAWRCFMESTRVWLVENNNIEFFKHRTMYPYPEVDLEELSFVILSSVLIGELE